MTAEEKRGAALEFIDFLVQSGAGTPVFINQLRIAARMWAYEQGATDDLDDLNEKNNAILETLSA